MKVSSKFIYLFGALGGLLFGYDTGVISGVLGYVDSSLKITPNSFFEGCVTASVTAGAIFGAIIIGKMTDKKGRKLCLLVASVVFIIGALISGFSTTPVMLLIGRLILGIAVGGASALVPMYLSEISPAKRRGSLSFLNQLMIVLGLLLAYVINFLMVQFNPDINVDQLNEFNVNYGWRISLLIAIIPSTFLFFGTLILPESPRYLVKIGKIEEAGDVLRTLRNSIKEVDSEILDIQGTIKENRGKFADLFKPDVRKAVIAAMGLAFFQQFTGCNTVIYYAPKVLELAGFDTFQSRLATVGIGVANVAATLIAIVIVDRVSRKLIFVVGGLCMALFTGLFALLISTNFFTPDPSIKDQIILSNPDNSVFVMICATLLLGLYIISFGISWGGTMWVVLGEIFPNNIRGIGVGTGSMTNWISNTVVIAIFPVVVGLTGLASAYWVLFVFCVLGVLFVIKFLPETKGKTLEEIEYELAS